MNNVFKQIFWINKDSGISSFLLYVYLVPVGVKSGSKHIKCKIYTKYFQTWFLLLTNGYWMKFMDEYFNDEHFSFYFIFYRKANNFIQSIWIMHHHILYSKSIYTQAVNKKENARNRIKMLYMLDAGCRMNDWKLWKCPFMFYAIMFQCCWFFSAFFFQAADKRNSKKVCTFYNARVFGIWNTDKR